MNLKRAPRFLALLRSSLEASLTVRSSGHSFGARLRAAQFRRLRA